MTEKVLCARFFADAQNDREGAQNDSIALRTVYRCPEIRSGLLFLQVTQGFPGDLCKEPSRVDLCIVRLVIYTKEEAVS